MTEPIALYNLDRGPEIADRLHAIESSHNVRILYAIESGSRAWGFPLGLPLFKFNQAGSFVLFGMGLCNPGGSQSCLFDVPLGEQIGVLFGNETGSLAFRTLPILTQSF